MFEEEAEAVRSVAEQAGHGVVVTRRPWCWGRKVWKAVHSCGHGVVKGGIVFRDGVVRAPAVRAEMMTVNACLSAPVFGVGVEESLAYRFLARGGRAYVGTLFPVPLEVRGARCDVGRLGRRSVRRAGLGRTRSSATLGRRPERIRRI